MEVFAGDSGGPSTPGSQFDKLKRRSGVRRVVVGDRGMIPTLRIGADPRPAELDWIRCLRAPDLFACDLISRIFPASPGGPTS